MAALGIHQHRIDDEGVTFPFPPGSLRRAGHIRGIAPFEHDPFDRGRVSQPSGARAIS